MKFLGGLLFLGRTVFINSFAQWSVDLYVGPIIDIPVVVDVRCTCTDNESFFPCSVSALKSSVSTHTNR